MGPRFGAPFFLGKEGKVLGCGDGAGFFIGGVMPGLRSCLSLSKIDQCQNNSKPAIS